MGEKYTNKRLKRILEFLYRNMSVEELEVLSRALLILFALRIEANTGKMLNLDEDGHWYMTEWSDPGTRATVNLNDPTEEW